MKILDHEQNTPEWFAAKCGVPSASNFDKIITSTGKPSTQKKKYLYRLAGECITKVAEETYQNAAMLRGTEMQVEALSFYELTNGNTVQNTGFCLKDGKFLYGASPDGLVGKDGMIEIKCPNLATHVGYIIGDVLPTDYFQQVQGQLLVSDRKWVDFMSYYPGMKPFIIRVKRDDGFIAKLQFEVEIMCREIEALVKKIR